MASSGFDEAVKACLHGLQVQLSNEHTHAVLALETRIRELVAENARLSLAAKGVGVALAAVDERGAAKVSRMMGRRRSEPFDVTPQCIQGRTVGHHSQPAGAGQAPQFSPVMPVIPGMLLPGEGPRMSPGSAPRRHDTPPTPQKKVSFGDGEVPSRNGSASNFREMVAEPPSPLTPFGPATPFAEDLFSSPRESETASWEPCGPPAPLEHPLALHLQHLRCQQSWAASPAQADDAYRVLDAWAISAHLTSQLSRSATRQMSRKFSRLDVDDAQGETRPLAKWMLKYMLRPNSLKHKLWELVSVATTLGDVGVVPLQYLVGPGDIFVEIQAWASRLHMTFDVFLPFFVGYVSQSGAEEMRFDRVAKQYAQKRLPINCILLAGDWMVVAVRALGQGVLASNLLLLVRAARAIRVARSQRMINLMDCILENITSEVAIIQSLVVIIILVFVLFIHVIACLWYGIHGGFCEVLGSGEDAVGACAEAPFWDRYTSSFHFVLALFVGEHIFVPTEVPERCFTIVVLVVAFIVSASIVGSLTTAMTRLQVIASRRSAQLATLKRYLSASGISPELAARVHRNADHALVQRLAPTDEKSVELLEIISEPLRAEIHYEVFAPVITTHPFFYLYNICATPDVRHICHLAMSDVSISPSDVLFSELELPLRPRMYFVVKGRLKYNRAAVEDYDVPPKTWISEAALWTTWTHLGTLSAKTECKFLVIDGCRFINVARTFSNNTVSTYAQAFVRHLIELKAETILTDIGEDTSETRELAYESLRGHMRWDSKEALAWVDAKQQSFRRGTKHRYSSPEPTKTWGDDGSGDDTDSVDGGGGSEAGTSSEDDPSG